MSIISTYIARVMDGLLLVASMEHNANKQEQSDMYRSQANQILKRLSTRSAAKCTIESGPYVFNYLIEQGICYMTLTDKGYPKRLAFLFLEDLYETFVKELKRDHGDNWLNKVETVARPYAFIKFDKHIQKKRKDYLDPSSRKNTSRLNDDLADIHDIMKKNIQEVLNRGDKIEHVSSISNRLVSESKSFKWGAKKLSLMALYNQYGPIAALVVFSLLIIYWKFFW